MRFHFQGCPGHSSMRSRLRKPWQTLHTDTGRQKHGQLTVTVLVLGILEVKTPTIFHKKKEQILASLLQKQELTKTVTSDDHFLISMLRRGCFSKAFYFLPRVLWAGALGFYGTIEEGREREIGMAEGRRGDLFKVVCP